ncbi:ATP-dependent DNA helicase UvrD2 [Acidipropionibacterium virtanenii]|uniref:DNA 3'-5' helicase n=1 Tax=Acidipropionibacterium virtanenii TaxID=2057246 RepID=A0A344UTP5_9ACTN|nr:ATP-dependent DNA helicase UvrD2 [Acidipropionibacterium virtanenii]AXE38643.1 ATP-dependent DNA helicase UvrD2 [Acidipropionibacterium virtanenii]
MTARPADQILEALDPEQREVASTFGVPVCVVAGAGTGKTRAITHRIAYAAATGRADPRRTLAVTFTTRAAGTMRARLAGLGVPGVQARTIHSAALRQVRYFWPRAYGCELPPVSDARFRMLAESARRAGLSVDTALLRDLSAEISWAKVTNVSSDEYPPLARAQGRVVAGVSAATVGRVLAGYEAVKQEACVIDLDDILLCAVGLLSDHPEIAAEVHDQYRHFVVDEYQDVSPVQHTLLETWFNGRDDVCVVGDPHQSIHAFAGARSDYLTGFVEEHPGAARIELVRNYRSTPEVVGLANEVLVHHLSEGEDSTGTGVHLVARGAHGPAPQFAAYQDEAAEASSVAGWLSALHDDGIGWSDLAVLHRVNSQAPAMESALAEAGIPYLIKGAERFYDRPEVRRAITSVTAAARSRDPEPGQALALTDEKLSGLGWTPRAPEGQGSVRQRWESLQALHDLAVKVVADHPGATLLDVSDAFTRRARLQQAPTIDGVTVSTMHAAKGLEWQGVAVLGASDAMIPFMMAEGPQEIAEERRLLHVAITRARERLLITYARSSTAKGRYGLSRFLRGLPGTPDQTGPSRARGRRRGARVSTCTVCGAALTAGADRKLGHHLACEVDVDPAVVDRLRAWRSDRAGRDKVPAFVVLTDATLLAVAERMPGSAQELGAVSGIGARKIERYAAELLAVLHPESFGAGRSAV